MTTAQLPALDTVNLELRSTDVKAVIRELFEPLRACDAMRDPDRVWDDLMMRTSEGFLALDSDIALPHARTGGVNRMVFAGGRHVEGFALCEEAPKAKLVFLVLTPKEKPLEYLNMLAALSARLRTPGVRAGLLAARTDLEFANLLDGTVP